MPCATQPAKWNCAPPSINCRTMPLHSGSSPSLGRTRFRRSSPQAFADVRDHLSKCGEASADFAEDAWSAPSWRDAAIKYHETRKGRVAVVEIEPERLARLRALMADDVSLESVWAAFNSLECAWAEINHE